MPAPSVQLMSNVMDGEDPPNNAEQFGARLDAGLGADLVGQGSRIRLTLLATAPHGRRGALCGPAATVDAPHATLTAHHRTVVGDRASQRHDASRSVAARRKSMEMFVGTEEVARPSIGGQLVLRLEGRSGD